MVNRDSWLSSMKLITGLKYIASDDSLKVFLCNEYQGLHEDILQYSECIDFSTLKNEMK